MDEMNTPAEKIEWFQKNLLFVKDVSKILRSSQEHVRRLVRAGKLPTKRVGRRLTFEPADISRYLGRHNERQIRTAVKWLAEVHRDAAEPDAQRYRLATLLMTTFFLTGPEAHELIDRWQQEDAP